MRKRLLWGDILELDQWRLAKRPAARRKHQPAHLAMRSATQALVNRVVFAVHGQQFTSGLFRSGHHKFARCHQNFLVRERDCFSELDRFVSSFEANHANRRGNYDFRFGVGANRQHSFAAMMYSGKRRYSFCPQRGGKFIGLFRVTNGDQFRPVTLNLADQLFYIAPSSQRDDTKSLRQRFHNGKALPANRTC